MRWEGRGDLEEEKKNKKTYHVSTLHTRPSSDVSSCCVPEGRRRERGEDVERARRWER